MNHLIEPPLDVVVLPQLRQPQEVLQPLPLAQPPVLHVRRAIRERDHAIVARVDREPDPQRSQVREEPLQVLVHGVVARAHQSVEHGDHGLALLHVAEFDPGQAVGIEDDLLRGGVALLEAEASREHYLLPVGVRDWGARVAFA